MALNLFNRVIPRQQSIFILVVLFFLGSASDCFADWQFRHVEIHSTMETLGGIAAILIALVLFREAKNSGSRMLVMMASGFVSMGVLDTAHAMSRPGDAFIFLHSAASLSGSLFFASVWLVRGRMVKETSEHRWFFWGAVFLSISVSLRALIYPGDVPRILPLYDGKFTLAAYLINLAAGLFFWVSIPRFYMLYRQQKNSRELLFILLAFLFGTAEMIFQFSKPWNAVWWIWHLIRLAAYLTTLAFVLRPYRQKGNQFVL